jgi:hypothetical protein
VRQHRDKYITFKDTAGTWDFKISEGWLTEEIWSVSMRSYFTGVLFGIPAGLALGAIIYKVLA